MRLAQQKRADLSMSTIVMAIIALLILIVLATMIVRNLGDTNTQVNVCRGSCVDAGPLTERCREAGYGKAENSNMVCLDGDNKKTGQICCV